MGPICFFATMPQEPHLKALFVAKVREGEGLLRAAICYLPRTPDTLDEAKDLIQVASKLGPVVIFSGEESSGKSYVLVMILGKQIILPSDQRGLTASQVELHHDPDKGVPELFEYCNGTETLRAQGEDNIRNYLQEAFRRKQDSGNPEEDESLFRIFLKMPEELVGRAEDSQEEELKTIFVDTPGTTGLRRQTLEAARAGAGRASVLVIILNGSVNPSDSLRSYWQEVFDKHPHLRKSEATLWVVNKVDLFQSKEECENYEEDVMKFLEEDLQISDPNLICTSALMYHLACQPTETLTKQQKKKLEAFYYMHFEDDDPNWQNLCKIESNFPQVKEKICDLGQRAAIPEMERILEEMKKLLLQSSGKLNAHKTIQAQEMEKAKNKKAKCETVSADIVEGATQLQAHCVDLSKKFTQKMQDIKAYVPTGDFDDSRSRKDPQPILASCHQKFVDEAVQFAKEYIQMINSDLRKWEECAALLGMTCHLEIPPPTRELFQSAPPSAQFYERRADEWAGKTGKIFKHKKHWFVYTWRTEEIFDQMVQILLKSLQDCILTSLKTCLVAFIKNHGDDAQESTLPQAIDFALFPESLRPTMKEFIQVLMFRRNQKLGEFARSIDEMGKEIDEMNRIAKRITKYTDDVCSDLSLSERLELLGDHD